MTRRKVVLLMIGAVLVGIILGGYLFSDTRPRSFLALNNCKGTCLQQTELLGLLTSVGIQRFSRLAPSVVKETDKTIVVKHPSPQARVHYLVIPKKDIKNIGELSDSDREYLVDSFSVVGEMVREEKLIDYRVVTNGPGYQGVTYLHFHLIGN
ncbi:MAG: HIT domain-containing protein [Acidobacteriota bacterium]|nr:HIT domain-containing protein [Acidobacteriota bacterium]